jgi:hypothetical protein
MSKKIIALDDYISARDAAQILSAKHGRPVSSRYIRSLSKRAKNPVATQQISNRLLYLKDDILACEIKQRR